MSPMRGIHGSFIAVLGILALSAGYAAMTTAASAASAAAEQLRYRVSHSVFGDIGTYTNSVQRVGNVTTVRTTQRLLVEMLGVGMRRMDADRIERWQDNRLVSFAGITKRNDDTVEVKGEARGNDFVIRSPLGTFSAPVAVQPANPWSFNCLKTTTMMRVDDGKLEEVRVVGGSETTVEINGTSIPTRQYEIRGATRYTVWFDQNDIPVMFAVDDDTGKVTFKLER